MTHAQTASRHGSLTGYTTDKCRCEPCRAAMRAYRKAWTERTGGRDPEKQKAWRKGYADRERALARERYDAERARVKNERFRTENPSYQAEWYQQNREAHRANQLAWRESAVGRASRRSIKQRYRARQRDLDCGCLSKEAFQAVWEHDAGRCYVCDAPGEHFDHVLAMFQGGPHCVTNLRVACGSCNTTKAHRPLGYLLDRLKDRGVEISPRLQLPPLPCPAKETR